MTAQVTWSVKNMERNAADGGVTTVYWSCIATDDTHSDCSAVEAGKLSLNPDAFAEDFIAYESLTEDIVLGWVYESLIEGEKTAEQAKTRIENAIKSKVDAQVARKTTKDFGVPWGKESDSIPDIYVTADGSVISPE